MAYGKHTLGMALSGCIPEFTYIGGTVPSIITHHCQVFHLRNQRPMAHGELTHGMALGGRILWGNDEIVRTRGLTPVKGLYLIQDHRATSLDPMVQSCPEQRRLQWNMANQGAHERQSHPPPCGVVTSDQVAIWH